MITERTLRRWRKDALREGLITIIEDQKDQHIYWLECQQRILRLTQELMDLYLLRKE